MNIKSYLNITALALLILFNACGNSPKIGRIAVDQIDVTIPVVFEENHDIKQFIVEYQDFANRFNMLILEIINIYGGGFLTNNELIFEEKITKKQLFKLTNLAFKQSGVTIVRNELLVKMEHQLTTLTEPEQRALQGIISYIDAQIGRFSDDNHLVDDAYIEYSPEDIPVD